MAKFTMKSFVVLAAFTMPLLLSICNAASEPVILSTMSQCVLFYDNKMPYNATQTIPTDQLPTGSTTITSSIGLVKTIVLTPAPSSTTTDLTATDYSVMTLTSRDNLTSTVYTHTVTVNDIPVSTKTYTAIVNSTVSIAATTTIPAFPGHTPLATQYSYASARFITESGKNWALQDEYWDKDAGFVAEEVMCNRGWYATAMSCYFTVYTADFSSTATIRHAIPAQTLTRTRYTKRTSTTRTVWAYPTPAPATGAHQSTISTDLTVTSSWATYIVATTVTSTATVEVYSSTATAYAACATNNLVNAFNMRQYDDSINIYPLDALRITSPDTASFDVRSPNTTSALDCCGHAAREPRAWFYRYQSGVCSIWVGNDCPAKNNTRPMAELWWSSQLDGNEFWKDGSMVVGNGACGGVDVVRPYEFIRD